MSKRIVVLHFSPIELYPPAFNLVRFLGRKESPNQVVLVTSKMENEQRARNFQPDNSNISVYRPGRRKNGLLKYAVYNIRTLLLLVRHRPSVVLYYESASAMPAIVYKWLFGSAKLMCHYHEYVSPAEYRGGMKLVRFAHWLEKKNYHLFDWISHTNTDRRRLFIADEGISDQVAGRNHVFPNYPPKSWQAEPRRREAGPVRLVYVGAMSLETTYLKELVDWVRVRQAAVSLDLYSNNYPETTRKYLSEINATSVRFNGAVEYDDLPAVLAEYHVGLVLYKGHIPNYIYNIPNKVFEYLAVGLTVWYPVQMLSCVNQFKGDDSSPQVLAVDFGNLPASLPDPQPAPARAGSFFFEDAKSEIVNFIEKSN